MIAWQKVVSIVNKRRCRLKTYIIFFSTLPKVILLEVSCLFGKPIRVHEIMKHIGVTRTSKISISSKRKRIKHELKELSNRRIDKLHRVQIGGS